MMKHLSLLFSLLLLAGCAIPNQARYQISAASPRGGPAAGLADKESVKNILQTAAAPLKLKDLTASSLAPNIVAYYQQIDSNTPVKLIAWSEGEKIFIELAHWPDSIGETMAYRKAREYIESELKQKFGERSSVVAFKNLAARTPTRANGIR